MQFIFKKSLQDHQDLHCVYGKLNTKIEELYKYNKTR
jgi:hypothetical protein